MLTRPTDDRRQLRSLAPPTVLGRATLVLSHRGRRHVVVIVRCCWCPERHVHELAVDDAQVERAAACGAGRYVVRVAVAP